MSKDAFQEEFDKYCRDTREEIQKVCPEWTLTYWGHYDLKKAGPLGKLGLSKCVYQLMGVGKDPNFLPGCVTIALTHTELGVVFDVSTDPKDAPADCLDLSEGM